MTKMVKITGMTKVLRNLKASAAKTAMQVQTGLKKGGLFLQRESMKIVPIDLNHLRPSARTDSTGSGFKTDVVVHYGAGADYAVYVHEDLEAKHKVGKQAKFLEQPARQKKNEIFKIVAKG